MLRLAAILVSLFTVFGFFNVASAEEEIFPQCSYVEWRDQNGNLFFEIQADFVFNEFFVSDNSTNIEYWVSEAMWDGQNFRSDLYWIYTFMRKNTALERTHLFSLLSITSEADYIFLNEYTLATQNASKFELIEETDWIKLNNSAYQNTFMIQRPQSGNTASIQLRLVGGNLAPLGQIELLPFNQVEGTYIRCNL